MIEITAKEGSRRDTVIRVDGVEVSFAKFTGEMGREWRPSHVFGYYSGTSGRLEALFNKHQERFYRALIDPKQSPPENETLSSSPLRPLFYARPVHSQFVLLSFFCRQEERQREILNKVLGIDRLESVLFVLREPPWATTRPNATVREQGDDRFWYARGVVKGFLGKLYELALSPIRLEQRVDTRFRKQETLEHLYLYLKDTDALTKLAAEYETTSEFFKTLESTYLSDLLADVRIRVWVRKADGVLTFRELSEGEQQLLTVLGLLEFTREQEGIFLLDEPDTHLNPGWSFDYVRMLLQVVGDDHNSHLVMATHDPLVIAALKREEVLVMSRDEDGYISANYPELDPQGLGVAGILTSDMFGLSSTIDQPTLDKINRRLQLNAQRDTWSEAERQEYAMLSDELARLGFNREFSDPYYERFAAAMARRHEATVGNLTPDEQIELDTYADQLLAEITAEADG